jgi:hypothetical protein
MKKCIGNILGLQLAFFAPFNGLRHDNTQFRMLGNPCDKFLKQLLSPFKETIIEIGQNDIKIIRHG